MRIALLLMSLVLAGCSVTPQTSTRVMLDGPLWIERWELDKYTCPAEAVMDCNAGTRTMLLCQCIRSRLQ